MHYTTGVNENPCKSETFRIANEIIAYLAEHPDAQDTFEGITEWWLLERKIKYQTTMVKEALDELVKNGFVVEIKRESTKHYKLNREGAADFGGSGNERLYHH